MKTLLSIIAALTAFFFPIYGVLIAVGVAISVNTATGMYKSHKLHDPIVPQRLLDVLGKLIVYECVMLFIYIIDCYLLGEFMSIWFSVDCFFTKIIALLMVGIELTSSKENIETATGKDILKWLRSFLKTGKEIKNDVNDLI